MPILRKPLIPTLQNISKLPKVLRVMIRMMLLRRLPTHIDQIPGLKRLRFALLPTQSLTQRPWNCRDGLDERTSGAPETPVDVSYDVSPEGPGVLVPDFGGVVVDCCAGEGSAAGEGKVVWGPRGELGVSSYDQSYR